MKKLIEERSEKAVQNEISEEYMVSNDTICRQVSNREPQLKKFSADYDAIVFVSGKKSSNGKALFEVCKSVNPKTYFISSPEELDPSLFKNIQNVGVCGATSTPMWLMEQVAEAVGGL
jgi:4-hydroxy-3-methylbut-2-enyl diphosphate reductase